MSVALVPLGVSPVPVGSVSIAVADGVETSALRAVVPCRLADTRNPAAPSAAPSAVRQIEIRTVEIDAAGRCDVPTGAVAIVVTITVIAAASAGFVTAWAANAPRPSTASGTYGAGETRVAASIVQLSSTGRLDVHVSADAHVVVDVSGAFVPVAHTRSGRFVPVDASRLVDTRQGVALVADEVRVIPLPAIPTDATAVAINLTVTGSAGAGYVSTFPAGEPPPVAASLTVDEAGQTRSAFAVVPVSSQGLALRTSVSADVIVDLVGWFTGESAADTDSGLYVPLAPTRILDTRATSPLGVAVPVHTDGGVEVPWDAVGGSAVVVVTAVGARPGFVTAQPAGTPRPPTATVTTSRRGETVTNLTFSPVSERGIGLFANRSTHLVVDRIGAFTGQRVVASLPPPINTSPTPPELPRNSHGCAADLPISAPDDDAEVIGTSVQGRPIIAEFYGDPAGRPVLIVGPVHGNECTPLILVERLRAAGRAGRIPPGIRLVILPSPNPDGLALGYRRNAHTVDLNRDGVTRREPETVALLDFTARLQPIASVHLHSPLRTTGGQGGPGEVGEAMAQLVADRTGLVMLPSMGRQSYYLWNAQALLVPGMAAVLVETPRGFPFDANTATGPIRSGPEPSEALWDAVTQALLDGMRLL